MYCASLKAGEAFSYSNKCIGINIIEKGFNLSEELHSIGSFRLEHTDVVLTDAIKMHFLNLEKVRCLPISKGETKEGRLINWMKIIDSEKKEDRAMLAKTSPIFQLLNEKIEEITRSPEEQRLFDARMKMRSDILGEMEINFTAGKEEGLAEGLQKGREEGSHSKAIETAKKLLDMGLQLENIAIATGLTQDEIKQLK